MVSSTGFILSNERVSNTYLLPSRDRDPGNRCVAGRDVKRSLNSTKTPNIKKKQTYIDKQDIMNELKKSQFLTLEACRRLGFEPTIYPVSDKKDSKYIKMDAHFIADDIVYWIKSHVRRGYRLESIEDYHPHMEYKEYEALIRNYQKGDRSLYINFYPTGETRKYNFVVYDFNCHHENWINNLGVPFYKKWLPETTDFSKNKLIQKTVVDFPYEKGIDLIFETPIETPKQKRKPKPKWKTQSISAGDA